MAALSEVGGLWTYRSFRNDPSPVDGDPDKALGLFFAEAVFDLSVDDQGKLAGAIDWPGGGLDLSGDVTAAAGGAVIAVGMIGEGRAGTGTEGWRYDYDGHLAKHWPNGVGQIPALVGSLIRVNTHGGAAAGYVASFVAVRRP